MEKKNGLEVKDLINIGVFCAIYFVAMFITGMVCRTLPILFIFMPGLIGLVCGTIYMLFLTKVKKKGMVLIMAIIIGTVMFAINKMWLTLAMSLIVGILAEIIISSGSFKDRKKNILGYAVYTCWTMGPMATIWLYRDWFINKMTSTGGQAYVDAIMQITPGWMFFVMLAFALAGGVAGGFLGNSLIRKHFKKSGIA